LALLAAPQCDVDLAPRLTAGLGVADQGHELEQRLAHAGAQTAAETSLERARILRHLTGNRREDLLGDLGQLGLDQVGDPRRKAAPWL
jgi:hypothetical protein